MNEREIFEDSVKHLVTLKFYQSSSSAKQVS